MDFDLATGRDFSFFTQSPFLMAVLNPDGTFLELNPAWEGALGFTRAELKAVPFLELLDEKDRSPAQLGIYGLLEGGRPASLESLLRRKDGGRLWVRWTLQRGGEEGPLYLSGQDVTEMKKAQESLEEATLRLNRLAESTSEGVALHERGVIREANGALARLLGYGRPEDLAGLECLDFIAPEFKVLARSHLEGGSEQPVEVVALRRDGGRFHCLLSGKEASDGGRRVRVATFLDITDLKKREQELFESQELLRKLTEASKDGVAVSEKGKILMANPALARMFGCEVSEMIGRNAMEFTAPEFRETLLKKIMDEAEAPYEVIGLRKDGGRFPVEITARMTSYQGRRVRLGFFRDISRRKEIEEEVRRQKEFSQNLINSSIDGLLAFDPEYRCTLWNPAMERLTGHSREEVLGRCVFDLFPFLRPVGEDRHFSDALQGKVAQGAERPYRTPSGRQVFFEAKYMPVKNAQGVIVGGLGMFRDVTEQKAAAEALRQSENSLKAVINNTFQNIILMDPKGLIRAFNQNAAAFLRRNTGKDLELGACFFDYPAPEGPERKALQERFDRALRGEVVQYERFFPTADGAQQWFEIDYHPVFGNQGEIEGVCFTSLCIDDRKKMQEALRDSEANLQALFNSSSQDITLIGRDGKVRYFNQGAARSAREGTGRELEAGRAFKDYLPLEEEADFKADFNRALKGQVVRGERKYRRGDGTDHWREYVYNPVLDGKGRIYGVCRTTLDIDDRKRAAEAIQKSEADLRAVFESSLRGFILAGPDGRVRDFNQIAQRDVRDFRGQELLRGRLLEDYLEPAYTEAFRERVRKALRGEVVRLERVVRSPEGEEHWFDFAYSPVEDPSGRVIGVCVSMGSINARKKAEEALRENEEKFRRIFEEAPLGMAMVADFRFIRVNRAFREMLGYTEEELLGKTLMELTHPGDLSETRKISQAMHREERDSFRTEKRYLRKDGQSVWVHLSGTLIRDGRGRGLHSLLLAENVTERKEAQAALRKSEAELRVLFNSVHQDIVLIAADGTVQDFNKSAAAAFRDSGGRKMKAGAAFLDYVSAGEREKERRRLDKALAGQRVRLERTYDAGDGTRHWLEHSYHPVADGKGGVTGVCFISQSIDERKEAEWALKESEEKFRKVFEGASIGMTLVDSEFRFLHLNRAFCEMVGYREEELVGRTYREITHPDDVAASDAHLERVRKGDGFQQQKRYLRKDGGVLWVHLAVTGFRDAKGGLLYSLGMVENVTDRRMAEEALRESEANLRAVFNSGSQATILIGRDGTIQGFNQGAGILAQKVLGLPLEKGMPFLKILPPGADPADFENSFREALAGRESGGERHIRPADGKERWVEVRYQPVLNDGGGVERVCFSVAFIDDRKRAEEELRESRERFERLAQVTQEGVMIHANGVIVDVNQALARMMGYEASEMIGRNGLDFLEDSSVETAHRHMREGFPEPYQVAVRRKDGSLFPAELQGRNFQDKGRDLRVLSIRDVTWRREAERVLRESEERYRRLVELTPEAIVVHSQGKVLYVNPPGLEMFGARPGQAVEGNRILDFLHPDSRETTLERMRRIAETNLPNDWVEQKLVRLDGQVFDAETKGTPVLYQGEEGVLTIVRDITHRKESERALKESEERYRRLVERSPEALLVHSEGKILYLNPAGVRLLGASRLEDLVGKPLLDVVHPDYREVVRSRVKRTLERGEASEPLEEQFLRLDGQVIDVEVQGIPFLYEGRPAGMALIRDITESKKIHNLLLRYERLAAVGKIIAAIAHEIRNPLSVVAGMSQILGAKLEARSEYSQELKTILAQTARLKIFMDDILDFSREMQIRRRPVDPRTLMEQALTLAQSQIGAAHAKIEVNWEWDESPSPLQADGERLTQVLVNLILNAYQAMGEGGTLTLSGGSEKGWAFLGVADDGPGVPEADLPHLFEPFFTTKKHGSGLGLSISQKIAEVHGGRIEARKLQPGMAFTLQLPVA